MDSYDTFEIHFNIFLTSTVRLFFTIYTGIESSELVLMVYISTYKHESINGGDRALRGFSLFLSENKGRSPFFFISNIYKISFSEEI